MALPIFGGMLIEPFTTFIVPTLYSAYVEFKMRAGLPDEYWTTVGSQNGLQETDESVVTTAA
jgi:hypothetical protein